MKKIYCASIFLSGFVSYFSAIKLRGTVRKSTSESTFAFEEPMKQGIRLFKARNYLVSQNLIHNKITKTVVMRV